MLSFSVVHTDILIKFFAIRSVIDSLRCYTGRVFWINLLMFGSEPGLVWPKFWVFRPKSMKTTGMCVVTIIRVRYSWSGWIYTMGGVTRLIGSSTYNWVDEEGGRISILYTKNGQTFLQITNKLFKRGQSCSINSLFCTHVHVGIKFTRGHRPPML